MSCRSFISSDIWLNWAENWPSIMSRCAAGICPIASESEYLSESDIIPPSERRFIMAFRLSAARFIEEWSGVYGRNQFAAALKNGNCLRLEKVTISRSAPSFCISESSCILRVIPLFSRRSSHSGLFSSSALSISAGLSLRSCMVFIMSGRIFMSSGITSSLIFAATLSVSRVPMMTLTVSLSRRYVMMESCHNSRSFTRA